MSLDRRSHLVKKYAIITFVVVVAFLFVNIHSVFAETVTDTDGDGLSDNDEVHLYHTDPNNSDTDGDGYQDGAEVYGGYSPRDSKPLKLSALDSDNDGAPDSWEIRLDTDLLNPDTDGDGYNDGMEIQNGYDPKSADTTLIEKNIEVSLKKQELSYYFGGVELSRFLISSGVASMPTPTGDFIVLDKVPVKNYGGPGFNFWLPNTKWNLHFTTSRYRYYIHGAYWHHNFGHPMSHGCVNVDYGNMERLYGFAQVGTKIHISSS